MPQIKPVDTSSFTPEQLQAFNRANALGTGVPTITPENLSGTPSPYDFQQDTSATDAAAQYRASLQGLGDIFNQAYQPTQAEEQNTGIRGLLQETYAQLGQEGVSVGADGQLDTTGALRSEQDVQAQALGYENFAALQRQLGQYNARIQSLTNEALAIPLEVQQQFEGRGVTRGGIAPIQAGRLRQNTIEALQVSALAQAAQGNLNTASQLAKDAVDAKYLPEQIRLNILTRNYELNKDEIERTDKRRAQVIEATLNERARILQERKAEDESIADVMLTARQYGAPDAAIEEIRTARSYKEAIQKAGIYLQDPAAKQALLNAQLDYRLKQTQIAKANKELELLDKYGGLSPEEALKLQEKELAKMDAAKREGRIIQDNITRIDTILDSSGLSTVVGASPLARGIYRQEGFLGGAVAGAASGLRLGFGSGIGAEIGGSADTVVSLTEQILSQKFLDKLIESKGQGATFGQLSDREGNALRAAASAISQTAIRNRNDKVIGYDMTETEFRNQLSIIQDALRFNYEDISGDIFTDDETALLEGMMEAQEAAGFNPSAYFPQR